MHARNIFSKTHPSAERVEQARHILEEKSADVAHVSRKQYRKAKRYAKKHPWAAAAGVAALGVGIASSLMLMNRKRPTD